MKVAGFKKVEIWKDHYPPLAGAGWSMIVNDRMGVDYDFGSFKSTPLLVRCLRTKYFLPINRDRLRQRGTKKHLAT